jgi:mRNA-degrading endonuclease RelE of RelBE toxin-antitoxin system
MRRVGAAQPDRVFSPLRRPHEPPFSVAIYRLQLLRYYAIDGRGDVKRLQGRDGYRLRVGEYRVIFDETRSIVLALAIGRRQTHTYG